ncbi:MAG: hypothetical protein ACYTAN_18680, partial [Planctomycetota bacterium]
MTFFLLALAMGVFALIVGQLFAKLYPQAVIPVFGLMVVAVGMGIAVYRFNMPVSAATVFGLLLMFLFIWVGLDNPVCLYKAFLSGEAKTAVSAALESGDLGSADRPGAVAAHFTAAGMSAFAGEVT